MMVLAKIHSFESFGTVDGPGVRFVVFMQGCPLRCLYCHNPDTWDTGAGSEYSVDEVYEEIMKYYNYIKDGGVTLSGGEPLLQIDFVIALFKRLKAAGLHTCIDTSGIVYQEDNLVLMEKLETLLQYTDLFLLDIKQMDEAKHIRLTGMSNTNPKRFAQFLDQHQKTFWIRYVLVPGYSDEEVDVNALKTFLDTLHHVARIEVLPYHTMGITKYEKMHLEYPLKGVDAPSKDLIVKVRKMLEVK